MPARFRRFHVLGADYCPYCTMIKGCIKMHLGSTSESLYNKKVCYHDRETTEGLQSWKEEVAHAVPASHRTIPCVVAEFSDGSLEYIGGVDRFVKKLGCPK